MRLRTWKKFFTVIGFVFCYSVFFKTDKKSPKTNLEKSLRIKQNELIDNHPIGLKYRILPNKSQVCPHNKIIYISYVYIDVKNFERRIQIRKSWSNKTLYPFQRNLFVLGLSENESLNQMIEFENERHGDILMGNFLDQFRLMYSKSVLALGWLTNNCRQAKFYVKLKHDIDLNPPKLASHLSNVRFQNYLLCEFSSRPRVVRNKKSKFYVKYSEYKPYHYKSRYVCSEHGYVLSNHLASKIFEASFKTDIFWIDDIYVSKIMDKIYIHAEKSKVVLISYDTFDLLNQKTTFLYRHRNPLTQDFSYAWNLIQNVTNDANFVMASF